MRDTLVFEQVKEEEAQDVLALYKSLLGTEYCKWSEEYPGQEQIDFDLSRDALFCLKNRKGEMVGVISIDLDQEVERLTCWSKELAPAGELSRLGVKVEYQNKGVARLLIQYAMQELKKRGYKGVHFLVAKENLKALRSYKKLKFKKVGECDLFSCKYWCYEKELLHKRS